MNDLTCAIPVRETERLILNAHRREDHAAVADMWSDTAVTHHIIAPENKPSARRAERHGFRPQEILTMNYKSVIFYYLTLD